MFKVGDRVKVVSEGPDFTGRGHSSLGMRGEVTQPLEDGGAYVKLDGDVNGVHAWAYDESEIAPEYDAPNLARPTLLDKFAMAALTGLVSSTPAQFHEYARQSYEIAQAMMKAREVQK